MSKMIASAALMLALAGCGDKTGEEKATAPAAESAKGVIAGLGDHESFGAMIERAGLATAIDGRGAYTVFAPSNAALAALPQDAAADSVAQRQRATAFVLAHVAPGTITLADLEKATGGSKGSATVRTMAGDTLTITRDGDRLVIARDGIDAVPIDATETRSGDDMIIGISGVLLAAP